MTADTTLGSGGSVRARTAAQIARTARGPRPLPHLSSLTEVSLPQFVDTCLANGLRVVALRMQTVPMVEVRLSIPFAGSAPAAAELLADTLLAGTVDRTRHDLDTALALIGGDLAVGVDAERLAVTGSALRDDMPTLLALLAEVIMSARFPAAEVRREKSRLLDRLALYASQPGVAARQALLRHAFGDHPLGHDLPEPEQVKATTAQDLLALHEAAVVPSGASLVIVSDLAPDKAVEAVEQALGGWASDRQARRLWPHTPITGGALKIVRRPDAVQSQIRLIAGGIARTEDTYPALKLANLVFGGYFSSRLVENVREDKGYTYSASSALDSTVAGSTMLVALDSARETTAAAVTETMRELDRMVHDGPGTAEVEAVRQYAVGALPLSLSTQSGLAGTVSRLASLGLPVQWLWQHPRQLAEVSPQQVRAAAAEFFAPQRFRGIVQGDDEVLAPALASLGWSV